MQRGGVNNGGRGDAWIKKHSGETEEIDVQIVSVRMYTQYKGPLDTLSTYTKPKTENRDKRQAEADN